MKDSGTRETYSSGMVREPEGDRPRFDLLLPLGVPYEEQLMTRCAAWMARGAQKYAARQWEAANGQTELDRYISSGLRHMIQWATGVEDGEDHAAAVVFNLLAAETVRYKMRKPYAGPENTLHSV